MPKLETRNRINKFECIQNPKPVTGNPKLLLQTRHHTVEIRNTKPSKQLVAIVFFNAAKLEKQFLILKLNTVKILDALRVSLMVSLFLVLQF